MQGCNVLYSTGKSPVDRREKFLKQERGQLTSYAIDLEARLTAMKLFLLQILPSSESVFRSSEEFLTLQNRTLEQRILTAERETKEAKACLKTIERMARESGEREEAAANFFRRQVASRERILSTKEVSVQQIQALCTQLEREKAAKKTHSTNPSLSDIEKQYAEKWLKLREISSKVYTEAEKAGKRAKTLETKCEEEWNQLQLVNKVLKKPVGQNKETRRKIADLVQGKANQTSPGLDLDIENPDPLPEVFQLNKSSYLSKILENVYFSQGSRQRLQAQISTLKDKSLNLTIKLETISDEIRNENRTRRLLERDSSILQEVKTAVMKKTARVERRIKVNLGIRRSASNYLEYVFGNRYSSPSAWFSAGQKSFGIDTGKDGSDSCVGRNWQTDR